MTEFYDNLIDDKFQNQTVSRVGVPPSFDNTERAHITRSMKENIRNRFQNLHQDNRVSSFNVLDQRNWPAENDNSLTYGNRQIKTIYNSFETPLQRIGYDINNALDEWKEIKLHINSNDHQKNLHPLNLWQRLTNEDANREVKEHSNILKIILLTEVYTLSTAVCERGFSVIKRIKSDWRNSLGSAILDTLMRVDIEYSREKKMKNFNPEKAINRWWITGQRSKRPFTMPYGPRQ